MTLLNFQRLASVKMLGPPGSTPQRFAAPLSLGTADLDKGERIDPFKGRDGPDQRLPLRPVERAVRQRSAPKIPRRQSQAQHRLERRELTERKAVPRRGLRPTKVRSSLLGLRDEAAPDLDAIF